MSSPKATAPGGAMQGTISWGVACAWIRLGQYDKALEIFETWLKNAIKREDPDGIRLALLNKGGVYVWKKDFGEAEKIAGELEDLSQKSPAKDAMGYYQALQGLIDLEKGDYSKGIDNFGKISGWYDAEVFSGVQGHAWYFYPFGFAYYKSGNLPKAREEFEKLTNLTAGRWDFGDLYAKSFYWLGKIAEEQRDKKRAMENYRKFTGLWKDADPGQPEVDDARARLAALS